VSGGSTTIVEFHMGSKIVAGCMARRERGSKMDNSTGTTLGSGLGGRALWCAARHLATVPAGWSWALDSGLPPIYWFALSALLICLQSAGLPCPPFSFVSNLLVCLVRPSHLPPIYWFALSALLICLQSPGLPCPPFSFASSLLVCHARPSDLPPISWFATSAPLLICAPDIIIRLAIKPSEL